MNNILLTVEETTKLINEGRQLVITASENLLKQLPKGYWIGGTVPYFMTNKGGIHSKDLLMVDDLTDVGKNFTIKKYDKNSIAQITSETYNNGFIVLILPFGSKIHYYFSLHSLNFPDVFKNPLVGYVSGIDIDEPESNPQTFYGLEREPSSEQGVAMHIELPTNKVARVEIINPNTIDKQSSSFVFPQTAFEQKDCLKDGEYINLAEYLTEINHPTMGMPLISNNQGALINRDIQKIDLKNKTVSFFSPVFADEKYYFAKKTNDFFNLYKERLSFDKENTVYSCLCLSFYLLGRLEGKKININGAFTFGEIAYQLLNQTAIAIIIDKY